MSLCLLPLLRLVLFADDVAQRHRCDPNALCLLLVQRLGSELAKLPHLKLPLPLHFLLLHPELGFGRCNGAKLLHGGRLIDDGRGPRGVTDHHCLGGHRFAALCGPLCLVGPVHRFGCGGLGFVLFHHDGRLHGGVAPCHDPEVPRRLLLGHRGHGLRLHWSPLRALHLLLPRNVQRIAHDPSRARLMPLWSKAGRLFLPLLGARVDAKATGRVDAPLAVLLEFLLLFRPCLLLLQVQFLLALVLGKLLGGGLCVPVQSVLLPPRLEARLLLRGVVLLFHIRVLGAGRLHASLVRSLVSRSRPRQPGFEFRILLQSPLFGRGPRFRMLLLLVLGCTPLPLFLRLHLPPLVARAFRSSQPGIPQLLAPCLLTLLLHGGDGVGAPASRLTEARPVMPVGRPLLLPDALHLVFFLLKTEHFFCFST